MKAREERQAQTPASLETQAIILVRIDIFNRKAGLENRNWGSGLRSAILAVKSFALRIRSNFVLSKRHRELKIAESKV